MIADISNVAKQIQEMSLKECEVWFITGASKGFGREYALYGLEKGHNVVATARNPAKLEDLKEKFPDTVLIQELDVTSMASIGRAINAAVEKFGRIDVLISNAGYDLIGPVEETTDEFLRPMFETNFFGSVALIRAVLPLMRQQKSGAIIQNSSVHGSTTTAGYGAHSASKCALDGLFEALYEEVKPFGIHAMLVKPGAFRTDVLSPGGNVTYTESIGVYDEEQTKHRHASLHGQQPGDPRRAAAATDKALHSEDPPLWLLLGNDCVDAVTGALHKQLQEIKRWETLSRSTDFPAEKA